MAKTDQLCPTKDDIYAAMRADRDYAAHSAALWNAAAQSNYNKIQQYKAMFQRLLELTEYNEDLGDADRLAARLDRIQAILQGTDETDGED